MHFIIGTAGHVDHGKTTLIRALTGIETDRLREEKERGLSIVPGFAHLTLPDGRVVGIVDVPGHERFLKNMLSGVSGVDVAMLVIAADEGVMPQTIEHLHILDLLRIKRAVIVLTKCDTVDADWLALAREDVRSRLAGTFLAGAPLVEVSSTRGHGLDALKAELARACSEIEAAGDDARSVAQAAGIATADARPFRMSIDRAFTVSGFGTVVTGSATEGAVAVGDTLEVWRQDAAAPLAARVRGIEVHGQASSAAERGQRTALNLVGLDLEEAARGGTVAAPGTMRTTRAFDAWLQILPDAPHAVKDGGPVRLHLGTAEVTARALLYEGKRLEAARDGYARLRLEAPLACARGDHFILREIATERILGGGLVLESQVRLSRTAAHAELPVLRTAVEAGDDATLAELLLRRETSGLTEADLRFELRRLDVAHVVRALHDKGALWQGGGALLHGDAAGQYQLTVLEALQGFHEREPLQAVMPREALRALLPSKLAAAAFDALLAAMAQSQQIEITPAGVRRAGYRLNLSEEELRVKERLEASTYAAGWQPPTLDELVDQFENPTLARKLCFAAVAEGSLVRVGEFVLAARRVEEGAAILRRHLQEKGTLAVGEARELLATSRKWVVPLLEFYDRSGLTRRAGEVRVLR